VVRDILKLSELPVFRIIRRESLSFSMTALLLVSNESYPHHDEGDEHKNTHRIGEEPQ